ncbi:MAG: rod shape-determining protein MreC, partial [Frankiales bacterium]|nr:rod shape-determining protein MreC [Frankiales bacterium]
MTVITGYGLVGRTLDVSKRTSTVLLLKDPKSSVGGSFVGYNLLGFAQGRGSGPLLLSFSSKDPVKKGTVVLTSGSIFQPGIPVGTITKTAKDPNGLVTTGTLVPFVDSNHLDLVGVIKGAPRNQPRQPFLPVAPTASSSPCPAAVPNGPVPTSRPSATPRVTVTPSSTATPTTTP